MASVNGAGAMDHPIFHPVSENDLAKERKVIVRSYIPGSEARDT